MYGKFVCQIDVVKVILTFEYVVYACIAGFLSDYTGDYDMTFMVAGALIFVSGFMLVLVPSIARRDKVSSYHLDTQPITVDDVTVLPGATVAQSPPVSADDNNAVISCAPPPPPPKPDVSNGHVTQNGDHVSVPSVRVLTCDANTVS